jgi:hypothetical protein
MGIPRCGQRCGRQGLLRGVRGRTCSIVLKSNCSKGWVSAAGRYNVNTGTSGCGLTLTQDPSRQRENSQHSSLECYLVKRHHVHVHNWVQATRPPYLACE